MSPVTPVTWAVGCGMAGHAGGTSGDLGDLRKGDHALASTKESSVTNLYRDMSHSCCDLFALLTTRLGDR